MPPATTVPAAHTPALRWRDRRVSLHGGVTALLGLVAGAGVLVWAYQVREGLVVTGMRDIASWGAYIAFFMWFIGLSAGGLIVANIVHRRMTTEWALWRMGFAELHVSNLTGGVMRLGMLLAGATLVAAFLAVVPSRHRWYTRFGGATMACLLFTWPDTWMGKPRPTR